MTGQAGVILITQPSSSENEFLPFARENTPREVGELSSKHQSIAIGRFRTKVDCAKSIGCALPGNCRGMRGGLGCQLGCSAKHQALLAGESYRVSRKVTSIATQTISRKCQ
jgi:hypothetical protein